MYRTHELSNRGGATRRTWLIAGGGLVAVLVLLALVVGACNARSSRVEAQDPAAGMAVGAATPTATADPTSQPADPDASDPPASGVGSGGGGTSGGNQSGGNQGGGNQGGGGDGDDEDGDDEDGDDEDDGPVVIDVSAKAAASVTPAQHWAVDCDQPTNITVHGAINLTGGLWLPAGPGNPATTVTVSYRWILDGEPGLSKALHFNSTGEKQVSTAMALSGNATAAIEIVGPNQSTSDSAAIHLFC